MAVSFINEGSIRYPPDAQFSITSSGNSLRSVRKNWWTACIWAAAPLPGFLHRRTRIRWSRYNLPLDFVLFEEFHYPLFQIRVTSGCRKSQKCLSPRFGKDARSQAPLCTFAPALSPRTPSISPVDTCVLKRLSRILKSMGKFILYQVSIPRFCPDVQALFCSIRHHNIAGGSFNFFAKQEFLFRLVSPGRTPFVKYDRQIFFALRLRIRIFMKHVRDILAYIPQPAGAHADIRFGGRKVAPQAYFFPPRRIRSPPRLRKGIAVPVS